MVYIKRRRWDKSKWGTAKNAGKEHSLGSLQPNTNVIAVTRTDMLYIHCPKTSRWQSAGEFSSRRKYCLLSLDPSSP